MSPYTVVIPAYNAARTLRETLESVFAQTVRPETIIVVDDGSSDGTVAEARKYGGRVQVLSQKNQGPGVAMSLGLRCARTPVIAALDADDLWLPGKMERQLTYLDAHPECDAVFTRMQCFGEAAYHGKVQDGWTRSSMVFRGKLVAALGDVVDPPGRRGEMVDWIARGREAGFQFVHLNEVLVRRRVAPGSLSYRRDDAKDRGYLHVARAALLRKRAARQVAEGGKI